MSVKIGMCCYDTMIEGLEDLTGFGFNKIGLGFCKKFECSNSDGSTIYIDRQQLIDYANELLELAES